MSTKVKELSEVFTNLQIKHLANLIKRMQGQAAADYLTSGNLIHKGREIAFQTCIEAMECLGLPTYPDVQPITSNTPAIQSSSTEISNAEQAYVYNLEENLI